MSKMKAIDVAERAKIGELMKESQSGSGKDKVDWIYSGNKVDRDAYLLGKPIDKAIQEAEADQQKQAQSFLTSTIDLSNKIREDPLFEIKKQEIEAKKRLLENPMRLKQIQQMLARKEGRDNRYPDHDRRRHRSDSRERGNDRDRRRDRSSSREKDNHRDRKHPKKSKKKHRHRSTSSDSSSRNDSRRRRSRSKTRSRSRTRSPPRRDSKYGLSHTRKEESESKRDEPPSSARREAEEYKKRIERLKDLRGKNEPSRPQGASASTKRMTDEEKQQKLREMQDNAKWRDDVRSKNISKYKSDEKKEENNKNTTRDGTGLFNNMMRDSYVSAEDRIRRNRKNVQRGGGGDDDDSSFVSRR